MLLGTVVLVSIAAAAIDGHDVPNARLTPGLIASGDLAQVCASDGKPGSAYSRAHRSMNENARRADFARYSVAWSDRHRYEDDHLVPLVSAALMCRKTGGLSHGGASGILTKRTGWKAMPAGWSARVNSISAARSDGSSLRPIGEMPTAGFSANRGKIRPFTPRSQNDR